MEKLKIICMTLLIFYSCADHQVSRRTISSIGGVKLFQSEIDPNSLLNNVVELRFVGAHGTGIYIGNGRFLTAAHNFTLRDHDIEQAILQNVTLTRVDGTKIDFEGSDLNVLFDPESETYITGQHQKLSVLFENDLSIVEINKPELITKFEEGAHFVVFTQKNMGGRQSLKEGDRVIGVGLNWELKEGARPTGMIEQIFGHRDVDTHFSYIQSTVDSFQETLPGSQSLKVYGIPDPGSSAQPGDSGGPIIKVNEDGAEVLVGVHHGRKPAGVDELSEFWAAQLIDWENHQRFLSPFSPDWKRKVKTVTKERIVKLDDQVLRSLLASALYIRQGELAWRSERKKNFKQLFNLLYMNVLTEEQLDEVLKVFYRYSGVEYSKENFTKVREQLAKVFPSETSEDCHALATKILRTSP